MTFKPFKRNHVAIEPLDLTETEPFDAGIDIPDDIPAISNETNLSTHNSIYFYVLEFKTEHKVVTRSGVIEMSVPDNELTFEHIWDEICAQKQLLIADASIATISEDDILVRALNLVISNRL